MRGFVLHNRILYLYTGAKNLSEDGFSINIRQACDSLHAENARNILLVSAGIEAQGAITRSANVTAAFVHRTESELGSCPNLSELEIYLERIEPDIRNALQTDYLRGYLPHLSDRQWIEYWSLVDRGFSNR